MADTKSRLIFTGIRGTILALDRFTGGIVWQTPLKGMGFVNIVIDGGDLIATTRGEVFCLDPETGRIRWNNPMRGFGYGLSTIATPTGSSFAVMAEHEAQQERSNTMATTTVVH